MTEKRYFLHRHFGRDDVIHDTLCHNWLKREELEEHMNVQYTKYSALKKENEQLKQEIKVLRDYGTELLEYINSPPKHRKNIFDAVICFKNKKR